MRLDESHNPKFFENDVVDIDTYEDFVLGWREVVKNNVDDSRDSNKNILAAESLTQNVLVKLIDSEHLEGDDVKVLPLFQTLINSAVICDVHGTIIQSNNLAAREFGLGISGNLADSGIEPENGKSFYSVFTGYRAKQTIGQKMQFVRCSTIEMSLINLIVTPLPYDYRENYFLVLFITPHWDEYVSKLLISQFNLTEVEAEIAYCFSIGTSLKKLAAHRGRSYTTIRNQFQSALEKTGCHNQAELLRLLLGISYIYSQLNLLVSKPESLEAKKIELIRPGGRFLEVRLLGDTKGTPFIYLYSIFGLPVTPQIQEFLQKNNLLMLGISRPGFGGTSIPLKQQDLYQCLADDVCAVMDSMQIEKCVFIGRASAARPMFNLERLIPKRISKSIIANALLPRKFIKKGSISSKWTNSLFNSSRVSASIAGFILSAGHKVMLKHGVEKFFTRVYSDSEIDKSYGQIWCIGD